MRIERCPVGIHAAVVGLLLSFASACHAARVADPVAAAEDFLGAFYSWDAARLASLLEPGEDADRVLYYQAWARAADYRVQTRHPCQRKTESSMECAVTVTDDFGRTLGYTATDTFRLEVGGGRIVAVAFEGDDPPIFQEVFDWMMADRPEVFSGPCRDLFAGGDSPADCARAVVQGAKDYLSSGRKDAQP